MVEDPRIAEANARHWAEVEATDIMREFSGYAPQALAEELRLKRDVYDGGADQALAVAEVLTQRQAAWLRGDRRWTQLDEDVPGKPELTRTSEGSQVRPEDET